MQKDILAKLLATENITVVHENAQTASFNVRDRVLTLPLWDDLSGDNYDHFIGHEVGHALYTPEDGWHDAVCDRGRAYKSFLNVIEDARIERLIQRKYPGLRRNFINSYKKLMADGFFGADIEEINTFDLIDRINTHFKLGASCGVRIEKDEKVWIDEIEKATTWEDVVDITDRLFAQEKAKKEEEREKQEEMQDDQGSDEMEEGQSEGLSDSDYNDPEENDDEQQGSESKGASADEDADEEEDEADPFEEESEGESEDENLDPTDPISKTEESLHDNIRKEFSGDPETRVWNIKLNTQKIDDLIIGYKGVLAFGQNPQGYGDVKQHIADYGEKLWKEFQVNNKKSVNYMVKEFEMRKKASEYARTTVAKTGVIDPVKMNNYKFSDDIFKKMSVLPEGKNHGMVLYLDWSGSMHKHIKPTIDQLLNLVMFCRQVNIPFRVYAFSDRFKRGADLRVAENINKVEVNTMQYKEGFRLLELFSNNMNRGDFTKMAQLLLAIGQSYAKDVSYYMPWQFYLGGTPLDDAIMAGIQIHNEFKKSNRLDIVNTVFLTDGDSHPIEARVKSMHGNGLVDNYPAWYMLGHNSIVKFIDPVTKKQYRVPRENNAYTRAMLQMFRDHTGSNAIGYRIVGMNKRNLQSDLRGIASWDKINEIHNQLKKETFVTLPNAGYSQYFLVVGGKNLEVANTSIKVKEDAKVGQIRTAFKKANANRKTSRVLLSKFIEMVA